MNTLRLASRVMLAAALVAAPVFAQKADDNARLQQDVQKALSKKQFASVKGAVGADGDVVLTGQVTLLSDKLDAERRIRKMHVPVNDQVEVAAPAVPDAQLYQRLAKQLVYDRQGYGTLPFNSIDIAVKDGAVVVRGMVVLPVDKDSALAIITNTPGVKALSDQLQVAPTSPMDDRIRAAEFRAVYGFPQLNRYAIDPAKPIRIVVVNGHVTLTGAVESKADAEIAGLRANGVPGVFSVENHLQVAGAGNESIR